MTPEQKEQRKASAKNGNIHWIKKNCLRTRDDKDDYVFISYKSDDFAKVLDDIVYHTCRKYGLRVYFDVAFDEGSDLWIDQYYENMCTKHCKAFIAFLDDAYYSSYACLLEMMSSQTFAAGGYSDEPLFFLPINLDAITDIRDESNTGLGTYRYSDGTLNTHAQAELDQFNFIFDKIASKDKHLEDIYMKKNKLYLEATPTAPRSGKEHLNVWQCRLLMQRIVPQKNDNDGKNKDFVDVIYDKLMAAGIQSVFDSAISSADFLAVPLKKDTSICQVQPKKDEKTEKPSTPVKENVPLSAPVSAPAAEDYMYSYSIFGKEYYAGKREQGKLMYDAFLALAEKHPDKIEQLTTRTCIARIEDVTNANTKNAKPPYFRACQEFTVGSAKYYVGTSYDFAKKITEIKELFRLCGEEDNAFLLHENQKPQPLNCFQYTLWNQVHTADTLTDMMHNVFDFIAEKYPDKMMDMAHDDSVSAVALKADVDSKKLPTSKLNYFSQKKEHKIGETAYYVSTRYDRENGIKQLEKMIRLCEGSNDSFQVLAMPEKSPRGKNEPSHTEPNTNTKKQNSNSNSNNNNSNTNNNSTGKSKGGKNRTGKKGISELL